MNEAPFQWTFAALTAVLLVVRIRWHRRAQILTPGIENPSEGRVVKVLRPLVLPLWLGAAVAWFVIPERLGPALLPVPEALRWFGAVVCAGGLLLLEWVHRELGTNFSPFLRIRGDQYLVTTGPYARVRHPMYTAFLLIIGGLALLSAYLWFVLTAVGILAAVLLTRTPREDAMLEQHFGDQYRAWKARTGALLPPLR